MPRAVALRVATFNAGLAVGVLPFSNERLPHVVAALVGLETDLLFVQEFWLDEHWSALRRAAATKFAHAFRPPKVAPARGAVCTKEELAPLVACAEKHCAGLRDEALARCVIAHCAAEGFALPADCLNCMASSPTGDLHQIVARCVGERATPLRADANDALPARADGLIAYGGSFGTGLLSRMPLSSPDVLAFYATVNARGAVHTAIDDATFGHIDVFGTHFLAARQRANSASERAFVLDRSKSANGPRRADR